MIVNHQPALPGDESIRTVDYNIKSLQGGSRISRQADFYRAGKQISIVNLKVNYNKEKI